MHKLEIQRRDESYQRMRNRGECLVVRCNDCNRDIWMNEDPEWVEWGKAVHEVASGHQTTVRRVSFDITR